MIFEKKIKGKDRTLCEPQTELKILQKRILSRILCHIQFPHYLHGGVKAADPRDFLSNAAAHSKAEAVIALDIRSFFPSVQESLVQKSLMHLCRFPMSVASMLSKLVTLNDQLPQGSPTSSAISNIVMFEKEYKLASTLEAQGFVYTRLIDDITISSTKLISPTRVTKIINQVSKMVTSYGFQLHPDKTSVKSRSNPKELILVTGLWLNRGAPKILREKRSSISKEVIELYKRALAEGRYSQNYHEDYNSISGKVALLCRLNHSRAERLRKLLTDVVPLHDDRTVAKISLVVDRFCRKRVDTDGLGYIKKFYRIQSQIGIVKRTHPAVAKKLQGQINKVRPTQTLKGIYA
ncbi:reverse transcriptase family protein [Pseudoduganella sp. SL102]|uniref:reverse transcriptase family protein n=1 Tax=Pseudoduganella sp. SL102 TaxID=2995154 RepID=UPI00248BD725|nr:reverse transcriptase family protein [Pseudoduganella sp. SL102]WBS00083.1 reverse transcriptase family protein [Pseudoduganella sp. SL102]